MTALVSGGAVTRRYDYDAYGAEKAPDPADANPFRYCGEYYDAESGQIYLRARYYAPGVGRFVTEDPARDGLNWYAYAGNNPVMFVDPTGLDVWYYVNNEFYEEAETDQYLLERKFGEPVHIINAEVPEYFISEWNKMGIWEGEEVPITAVVLNLHANPRSMALETDWGTVDV